MRPRAEIDSAITKILIEQLGHDFDTLTDDKRLMEDLNADSLDMVEIVMACEEEFGIEIPDAKVMDLVTVRDLANLVESYHGE